MSTLEGTGRLIRLILRRDRLRLSVWVVLLVAVPLGTASAFIELYPDAASREELAATVSSAGAVATLLIRDDLEWGAIYELVATVGLSGVERGHLAQELVSPFMTTAAAGCF